jgi:RNA polymerase sigma-70 factor (ECF subfamily)
LAAESRIYLVTPSAQSSPSLSSEELSRLMLAVANERDRQAFAAIFSYFAPRLKGFLLRSGITDPLAEEIIQETMLAVWQKADYFDPGRAGVSTWIFTIARNQRIDRLRRERERTRDHADSDLGSEEQDEEPSAEAMMVSSEEASRLHAALKTLSAEQAQILRLSFFMEKPHSDIARELGLPLGTVKSRVRLAMGHLRALLGGLS